MSRIIRQATREKAWTRTRLMGASNSGKTLGSLYLAQGLTENHMERVCVIDTEKERSRLFAPAFGNRFDVLPLDPPFSPERYIEAMAEALAEKTDDGHTARYEVIIIDSGTHEWAGPGGCLSEIDRIKKNTRNKDEMYAVWNQLTPRHDAFIEQCIIRPAAHIIFCTRAKGEYDEIDVQGKKKRVKVGIVDIQREGLEFEFTFGFRLEGDHMAYVEKDTSFIPETGGSLFDGHPSFTLSADTGRKILQWLNQGAGTLPTVAKPLTTPQDTRDQRSGNGGGQPAPVGAGTPPANAGDDEVQMMRARLLGLFKTALKTDDRKALVAGLGKMSSAVFPDGAMRESFKALTRLEVETLLMAAEHAPKAVAWYDIAQARTVPMPAAPLLFPAQQPPAEEEEPEVLEAAEEVDDELGF